MVAGDIDEPRAGALAGEQRAHHLGVLGAPERPARQAERIDDVADEHDGFRLDAGQELIELARPGVPVAKVYIRQEQRSDSEPAGVPGICACHDPSLACTRRVAAPRLGPPCVGAVTVPLSVSYDLGPAGNT